MTSSNKQEFVWSGPSGGAPDGVFPGPQRLLESSYSTLAGILATDISDCATWLSS
jgi:hypothetical protein